MTARHQSRRYGAALGAVLLVSLCLRAAGLDHQSFWIDEIASLQLAGDSLSQGFRRIRGDVHPPGYFSLLHLWVQGAILQIESRWEHTGLQPALELWHGKHLCGRAMPLFSRTNSSLLIRTVSVRSV